MRVHRGRPGLRFGRGAVVRVVHLLDAHAKTILGPARPGLHPPPPGELSLAFLTPPALAQLHAQFLDDPSATDVITFPGNRALGQAGEICISADAARAFAAKYRRDCSEELIRYVVHGWLHLAGLDDAGPAGRRRMRAAERRALDLLRATGRIPRFAFAR